MNFTIFGIVMIMAAIFLYIVLILFFHSLEKKVSTCEEKIKQIEEKLQTKFEKIDADINCIGVDDSLINHELTEIKDFIGYEKKDEEESLCIANYNISIIKDFFKSDRWTNEDFKKFTSIPVTAEILASGIEPYIDDAIQKALQVSTNILETFAKEYQKKLHAPIVSKEQAESLPEGWVWVSQSYEDDFDFHLESPDGIRYFTYDPNTGDYKQSSDSPWNFFLIENLETGQYERASFSEFKAFAEEKIRKNILDKE